MKQRDGLRTRRQAKRWKRKLERQREIQRELREAAPDILHSNNFVSRGTSSMGT